ncbi:MAG: dual specificity protein phosphatase family protein, partial [Planctomycetes bacterium]|nr:dual specificity protein phosphatase family protein [Planctomycetota bacterium]
MFAADLFSWIINDKIGGMPKPDCFGTLENNLAELKSRFKIGVIVNLTEENLDNFTIKNAGLKYYHIPIAEFSPPTMQQLFKFKKIYETETAPIAVHCLAGMGRTGTILATALVLEGYLPESAINKV